MVKKETPRVPSNGVFLSVASPLHAEVILSGIDGNQEKNIAFFSGPLSIKREKEYLLKSEKSSSDELFMIDRYSDLGFAGVIGLHEIDNEMSNARMGMMMFSHCQGYGLEKLAVKTLLSYAFDGLGINTVYINVPECNEYMIEVYNELPNFKVDGRMRQRYKLRDGFYDILVFSAVLIEWDEMRDKQ